MWTVRYSQAPLASAREFCAGRDLSDQNLKIPFEFKVTQLVTDRSFSRNEHDISFAQTATIIKREEISFGDMQND